MARQMRSGCVVFILWVGLWGGASSVSLPELTATAKTCCYFALLLKLHFFARIDVFFLVAPMRCRRIVTLSARSDDLSLLLSVVSQFRHAATICRQGLRRRYCLPERAQSEVGSKELKPQLQPAQTFFKGIENRPQRLALAVIRVEFRTLSWLHFEQASSTGSASLPTPLR